MQVDFTVQYIVYNFQLLLYNLLVGRGMRNFKNQFCENMML